MRFDIWYDLGAKATMKAAAAKKQLFEQWRLYIPLPRTHAEVGKAVEKILDKHGPISISIAESFDKKTTDIPRRD